MDRRMKLYVCAGLLVAGMAYGGARTVAAGEEKTRTGSCGGAPALFAVRTTAQWCKVCKAAQDSFAELTHQLRSEPVLFITLDRTDEFTSGQASYLASALGISESLAGTSKRVGELHLIDARSKAIVSTLSLSADPAALSRAIRKSLASIP